jgi:oligosaccharyltransferase complex subunit epsilon
MPGPKTPKPSKPKPTTPAGPAIPATASPSTTSPSAPASAPASTVALRTLWIAYLDATPARLKLVDAFLAFLVLSGVAQFAYCVLVTSFPYNAFLAG